MKILHVGLCVDGKNEGLPYALKKASTFYHEISTGEDNLRDKIMRAATDYEFEVAFFQIQAPNIVNPDVFEFLNKCGIYTVNWSGDIRNRTEQWYFETGAHLTLFTNMRDVDNLRANGLKSDFLQIGIDPVVFNIHTQNSWLHNVVYMGNNYGRQFPLGNERLGLVANLQRWGYAVYGSYRGAVGNLNGNQKEESFVYNQSKIAINHSHFNEERYTSDRMFRILASGTMCLSHHYKGIEKDFNIGYHLDTYRNLNELRTKIDYYLNNEPERKRIAKNGYDYCHKNHSYKSMVENLINLIY